MPVIWSTHSASYIGGTMGANREERTPKRLLPATACVQGVLCVLNFTGAGDGEAAR